MSTQPAEPGAAPAHAGAAVPSARGAQLLDGKAVATKVRAQVARRAANFAEEYARRPGLAVVQVGSDPASSVYVRNKRRSSEEVGIESLAYDLPADTSEERIVALVEALNHD